MECIILECEAGVFVTHLSVTYKASHPLPHLLTYCCSLITILWSSDVTVYYNKLYQLLQSSSGFCILSIYGVNLYIDRRISS
jgi:hypothetical protein